ncbi:hypothetical protein DFS34DRAFT_651624 [Phlyctochytrium arcticum]|nr:hypothetical protein DFS34DRAFT_651624 [Phlyctochytrium arcticum]
MSSPISSTDSSSNSPFSGFAGTTQELLQDHQKDQVWGAPPPYSDPPSCHSDTHSLPPPVVPPAPISVPSSQVVPPIVDVLPAPDIQAPSPQQPSPPVSKSQLDILRRQIEKLERQQERQFKEQERQIKEQERQFKEQDRQEACAVRSQGGATGIQLEACARGLVHAEHDLGGRIPASQCRPHDLETFREGGESVGAFCEASVVFVLSPLYYLVWSTELYINERGQTFTYFF